MKAKWKHLLYFCSHSPNGPEGEGPLHFSIQETKNVTLCPTPGMTLVLSTSTVFAKYSTCIILMLFLPQPCKSVGLPSASGLSDPDLTYTKKPVTEIYMATRQLRPGRAAIASTLDPPALWERPESGVAIGWCEPTWRARLGRRGRKRRRRRRPLPRPGRHRGPLLLGAPVRKRRRRPIPGRQIHGLSSSTYTHVEKTCLPESTSVTAETNGSGVSQRKRRQSPTLLFNDAISERRK